MLPHTLEERALELRPEHRDQSGCVRGASLAGAAQKAKGCALGGGRPRGGGPLVPLAPSPTLPVAGGDRLLGPDSWEESWDFEIQCRAAAGLFHLRNTEGQAPGGSSSNFLAVTLRHPSLLHPASHLSAFFHFRLSVIMSPPQSKRHPTVWNAYSVSLEKDSLEKEQLLRPTPE